MQREMMLFRGATMPKGRMAYLGRFAEGTAKKKHDHAPFFVRLRRPAPLGKFRAFHASENLAGNAFHDGEMPEWSPAGGAC